MTGPTYDGAPEALIGVWNIRRRALTFAEGEALPPLDCDLAALKAARVPENETLPKGASPHATKRHETRRDLAGHSELAALNALLIAHLRKKRFPRHTPRLFRRIWIEEGPALIAELPPRWLISSIITFGDHGWNESQRRLGLALNMLFSMMKLYEFERLHSGRPGDRPFGLRRSRDDTLPLGMPRFALIGGGLDINLLAPIWQMAQDDTVAGPLALHLLTLLNDDPRGLFRRLGLMREELRAFRAAKAERAAAALAANDAPE